MVLSSKIKVPLPDHGITIRRKGKYHYVYKVLRAFRNEAGQPTNIRKSIGKVDPEGKMLIPNDAYWDFYGDTSIASDVVPSDTVPSDTTPSDTTPAIDSVRSVGATFFIEQLLESLGILDILQKVFGDTMASAIMTASEYMVCRGNVFEHVANWCEGYTFKRPFLTSQSASSLFSSISHEKRMAFFREWVKKQADNEYFAYDVTSFSSYAKGIAETEWGYNRDKEKLPQINFGCYLGQNSGLPVFYTTYPGSIVDKSHMKYMMAYNETLGIDNVCFIMDRGFCTTANVKDMHASHRPYIIGVPISHKTTRAAINEVRDGILSMRNFIKNTGVYAHSIHSRFYGVTSTIHIYWNPDMAEEQRRDLYRTVEAKEEILCQLKRLTKKDLKRYQNYFSIDLAEDGTFQYERNYEKIDDIAKSCGFFCLLTNTQLTSSDVLAIYRRKDTIEKGFDDIKNHIDMKRLRTHSSDTTDGKMFCAFIALIAATEMDNKLAVYKKEKSMSKMGLISELEKIKVVFMDDGRRLMNPITKTQRTILEYCGFSEKDLNLYISY